MSNVLKNFIFRRVESVIENEMLELQEMFGVKAGDISPMQSAVLESIEKNLAVLLCDCLEQNCEEMIPDGGLPVGDISNISIDSLLRLFLQKEARFRMKAWFDVPESQLTDVLVNDVAEELYKQYDEVMNVEEMDKIISDTLAKKNIQY